jgi:peptide/nickel transport system substrate-binding protein
LVLRKAIAHAIDKQDLVDIVLGGYGEIPDAWTYLESPNHHPTLPQYTYNVTKARQMLLDAGYTYVE